MKESWHSRIQRWKGNPMEFIFDTKWFMTTHPRATYLGCCIILGWGILTVFD